MHPQSVSYKGFIITAGHTQHAGWCVIWQELAGDTVHRSYNHPDAAEAMKAATAGIDRYYEELEKENGSD